jgi:endoribonuclease Dicer
MTPQVALAEQQCRYVLRETDINAVPIYGEKQVELQSKGGSHLQDYVDKAELLVGTGGVLKALLELRILRAEEILLLVLDECHQARGQHDYVVVVNATFTAAEAVKGSQLRVVGLTAAPASVNVDKTAYVVDDTA